MIIDLWVKYIFDLFFLLIFGFGSYILKID